MAKRGTFTFLGYHQEGYQRCNCETVFNLNGKRVCFVSTKAESKKTGKPYLTLISGGKCVDGEYCTKGPWEIDVDPKYEKFKEILTELINDNIPYGCCGDCL